MTIDNVAPLACALSPWDFRARASWLQQLTSEALICHSIEGPTVRLTYKASAASDVERLVHDERECCGFLSFAVSHVQQGIELRITAPPDAADDLRVLLSHLIRQ
jgi:hypothetical protein